LILLLSMTMASCATNLSDRSRKFALQEPNRFALYRSTGPISVFPTFYYTPEFRARNSGYPLLDMEDRPLTSDGVTLYLGKREWCMAALEGSASVRGLSGTNHTINYAGVGSKVVDCRDYLAEKYSATNRVRFKEVDYFWGEGRPGCALVPFRTIAVDPDHVPLGSVVYIPQAHGAGFRHDGKQYEHDGYFFAADTGGVIKGRRIDIFSGRAQDNRFSNAVYSNGKNVDIFVLRQSKVGGVFEAESGCSIAGD